MKILNTSLSVSLSLSVSVSPFLTFTSEGKRLPAEKCLEWGLVNRVLDPDQLMEETQVRCLLFVTLLLRAELCLTHSLSLTLSLPYIIVPVDVNNCDFILISLF